MDISFPDILATVFDKHKKDYLTITQIKKSLPKGVEQILGLQVKKITNTEFIERLKPQLSDTYSIHKKGNSTYLLRAPIQDIILSYITQRSPISIRMVSKNLRFQKGQIAEALNNLARSGAIELQIVAQSKDFNVQILVPEKPDSSLEIKKAYNIIRKDRNYVKIYELRRYLNWPRQAFDSYIQSLWNAGVIELQASDPQLLTEDQRGDSFMDTNHTLRILLIWRRE